MPNNHLFIMSDLERIHGKSDILHQVFFFIKRKKIHKKKSSIKLAFNGFNLIMLQANFHFFYIYTIFFSVTSYSVKCYHLSPFKFKLHSWWYFRLYFISLEMCVRVCEGWQIKKASTESKYLTFLITNFLNLVNIYQCGNFNLENFLKYSLVFYSAILNQAFGLNSSVLFHAWNSSRYAMNLVQQYLTRVSDLKLSGQGLFLSYFLNITWEGKNLNIQDKLVLYAG